MISTLVVLGKVILPEMNLDRPCWAVVMLGWAAGGRSHIQGLSQNS